MNIIDKIKDLPIIKLYIENKALKKEVIESTIINMKWGFKNIKTISDGFKDKDESLWILIFERINNEADKYL